MNDQLAVMVQKKIVSLSGLKEIEGVGEGRIKNKGLVIQVG